MNSVEKEVLRKVVESGEGLLSPAIFINSICNRDKKTAHSLISSGYIEEVPNIINGQDYIFYRATIKGRSVFYPFCKRFLFLFKDDIRTIVVAMVTTIVTLIISNLF